MKKILIAISLVLMFAAASYAQYNIHLKNGSVFRGIHAYHEVDGELRFMYMGGTVGIPVADVARIENTEEGGTAQEPGSSSGTPGILEHRKPVVPPYQQTGPTETVNTAPIKQRLAEINKRLASIDVAVSKYDKLKEEYDKVRLRIEVLFQKGIAAAKNVDGDPAKWYQYLPPQEREWAQLNTFKKTKLKKELDDLETRMAPVLSEQKQLLAEKKDLERQLREAENPY